MGPLFRVTLDRLLPRVTAGGQTFVNIRIDFCGEVSRTDLRKARCAAVVGSWRDRCRSGDSATARRDGCEIDDVYDVPEEDVEIIWDGVGVE